MFVSGQLYRYRANIVARAPFRIYVSTFRFGNGNSSHKIIGKESVFMESGTQNKRANASNITRAPLEASVLCHRISSPYCAPA